MAYNKATRANEQAWQEFYAKPCDQTIAKLKMTRDTRNELYRVVGMIAPWE
jgi:hypothetical protein